MNDTPTPRVDAQTFNQEGKRPTGEEGEILSVPVEFARDVEPWKTMMNVGFALEDIALRSGEDEGQAANASAKGGLKNFREWMQAGELMQPID